MAGAFLSGYLSQQRADDDRASNELRRAGDALGILSAVRQREDQEAIRGVLSASPDPFAAIPKLTQLGPSGVAMAGQLAQLQQAMRKETAGQPIGSGGLRLPDGTIVPPAMKPEGPQSIGAGGLRLPDGTIVPPVPRPAAPPAASQLSRLIAERDALPPNDPRRPTYDNAIRKESETARQISPTIINTPAPTMKDIIDPKDPNRMISVDAKTYRGGSVGDVGVLGVAGKEPTAARKAEAKDMGRDDVSKQIASLRDAYLQLQEKGSITDPAKGALSNLGAAISSSGAGQMVGRALGTEAQSLRSRINQQRPLLLQSIKQATGMSAQQMNSNAELRLFLSAATDPTLDIAANLEALDNIDRLYGSGASAAPTATPITPNGKWSIRKK